MGHSGKLRQKGAVNMTARHIKGSFADTSTYACLDTPTSGSSITHTAIDGRFALKRYKAAAHCTTVFSF